MNEEWRAVVGYEGLYEVSSYGKVRSVDRHDASGHFRHGAVMRTDISKRTGYERVSLCREGIKTTLCVHRLVAQAFIPIPDGNVEVNHINEDRADNRAENLEWVTRKQNSNHGHHNERLKLSTTNSHGKPVIMVDVTTGKDMKEFVTCSEAARYCGLPRVCISNCCRGKQKTAGGYSWRYKE